MTDKQCEKLIDYFNGQMLEEEKETFEKHLESCEECREELAEWEELSADLPFLSEVEEPPQGMKERVLTSVWNSEESTEAPVQQKADERKHSLKRAAPIWLAGAAAAALLFSLAGNGYLLSENQQLAQEREQLAEEAEQLAFERDVIESDYQALLEEEEEDGTGVANVLLASNLASADEELFSGEGSATIISEDGHVDLLVQVSGMPDLEDEEAFQAWIIEGETPVAAGSFNIDENGNGAVRYRLSDMDDIQVDQIAITLEPQPNNEQPQGQVVLASP
ncbi:anti-sigma factor domain-containing protein [Alkalicoccus halolimnae]|uniref:Anti-sigma-W factor RsiW n=1 Tax=Alkalicoccus halolimnae TaxID=1667239 RepID=A0AAJ8LWT5_9BACI